MIQQPRIREARHPRQRDRSWPCRPRAAMKPCRRGSPRLRNSWAVRLAPCDTLGALVMPLFLSVFTISRRSSTRKPLTTCRQVPSICRYLEVSMRPGKGNNNRSLFLLSLTDLQHHLRRNRSWTACRQEQSAIKSSHSTSNRSVCTTFLFCRAQGLHPETHLEFSALGFVTAC